MYIIVWVIAIAQNVPKPYIYNGFQMYFIQMLIKPVDFQNFQRFPKYFQRFPIIIKELLKFPTF